MLNTAKVGQSVPVKFSLNGDQGLEIFAAGYPKPQPIDCDTSAKIDAIEETASGSSTGLSYDPATDQYTYVWKTDKKWANTCRQLIVKLDDGSEYKANFKSLRQ
jgi:hypothetical protein